MVTLANDIRFTGEVAQALKKELSERSFSSLFILTDSNTAEFCLPLIQIDLPQNITHINVPAGEAHKTLATCEIIWQELTDKQADRHSLMLNLGGGVVCDMGGFCAKTFKRGIEFWNIPTTVLSQVDASVGGKLGVDFGSFKNHIGLFAEPEVVFIDPVFFKTLPREEVVSGFAEMVKHTLIRDKAGFEMITQENIESLDWAKWIPNSVEIKKAVVEADPTEKGLRKILNFGHTIGHAIESYFLGDHEPLKHGEAIALGMIAETYLSTVKLGLEKSDFEKITNFIANHFPTPRIGKASIAAISELAVHDKKNKDGIINAVLLRKIGSPEIDIPISKSEIIESLEVYNTKFTK